MKTENSLRVVLTIAGFDPSGGAGIIADIRTLASFGCRPVAAITSLTFQNSEKLFGAVHQSAESVRGQIQPVMNEFHVAAVKIGMLPTRELVLEVARLLRETSMPAPIVDPVLGTSSGYELMEPDARAAWLTDLMPLARLITPNIPEAETFSGMVIRSEGDMRIAANKLREKGAAAVLIKGGHLEHLSPGERSMQSEPQRQAIDVLDDDGTVTVFRGDWIEGRPLRGTGCMLSAAIAAGLAHGMNLNAAVTAAKKFVREALRGNTSQPAEKLAW
jgi:hydroxymethylpyrimidine kinase/phosphomethylpyrimidine kinase